MILDGLRVLVVDDDHDTLDAVCFYLQRHGASVECLDEAEAALRSIAQSPPDVLLSDIAMPEHDGIWLIQQVRQLDGPHGGKVPAAAVTAHGSGSTRDAALAAGFDMFVSKPLFPERLVSMVERLASEGALRA